MKISYHELSSAQIADKRRLVISECLKDGVFAGYTLAQQIEVEEGKKVTKVFLRNGIHVADTSNLEELRDAINVALDERKKKL